VQAYQRNQPLCQPGCGAVSEGSAFPSYQISINKDNGYTSSPQFHLCLPFLICSSWGKYKKKEGWAHERRLKEQGLITQFFGLWAGVGPRQVPDLFSWTSQKGVFTRPILSFSAPKKAL